MKIVAITPNRKRDYLTESTIEGLLSLGCQIYASDVGNGLERACSDDEIVAHAKDADLVIVFFGKVRDNNPPKRYLLDRMGDIRDKLMYVEDSEWTCTAHPEPGQVAAARKDPARRRGTPWLDEDMLRRCRWYLKHSCYAEDIDRGVIPFQISIIKDSIRPPREKDIDLLCTFGQVNDGLRKEAQEISRRIESEGRYRVVTKTGMSKEEYFDVVSRARISVDGWGGSQNNPRFWEGVANGACGLYQGYTSVITHPFTDFVNAVSYSTPEEFERRVRFLLEERELSLRIGAAGREHALRWHTSTERAKYLLKIAEGEFWPTI